MSDPTPTRETLAKAMSRKPVEGNTPGPWVSDGEGCFIFDPDTNMVAQIRGWGHLQKLGEAKAVEIQKRNGDLIATAPDLQAENQVLQAAVRQLGEALANFGTHDRDCLLSQGHAGRPTEDGGYETKFGDEWYQRGEWPECTCGLSTALAKEKER